MSQPQTSFEKLCLRLAEDGQGAFAIAAALNELSRSMDRMTDLLGNNRAATSMGALEALGRAIEDGLGTVAAGLGEIADSRDRDA